MSCTRAVEYTVVIVNMARYQGMNERLCSVNEQCAAYNMQLL